MNQLLKTGLLRGLLAIAFLAMASPAMAQVIQSTLGGQKSDGTYHFTVTSDGKLNTTGGSGIALSNATEVLTEDTKTVTAAENGTTFILNNTTRGIDVTLPDCSTTKLQYSFVAALAKVNTVDTGSTGDTIKYLTLDAGDALDTEGNIADSITLQCYAENTWLPLNVKGTWADGGAN